MVLKARGPDDDALQDMILYKRVAGDRFWLVEASFTDAGDLVISSGDNDAEWQAIVRPADLPLLVSALPGSYPPWPAEEALDLLSRAFPRDDTAPHGPFEAIKAFLEENGIPWQSSAW